MADPRFYRVSATEMGLKCDAADTDAKLQTQFQTTAKNVGAVAGEEVVAAEYGDGYWHRTILTITDLDLGEITGGVAQAVGAKFYTLPAGAHIVKFSYSSLSLHGEAAIQGDTPDFGIGTLVGSGANATLDAVGADAENIQTGAAKTNCAGTVDTRIVSDQILNILAGDSHELFINAADNWAAGGSASLLCSGIVILDWIYLTESDFTPS